MKLFDYCKESKEVFATTAVLLFLPYLIGKKEADTLAYFITGGNVAEEQLKPLLDAFKLYGKSLIRVLDAEVKYMDYIKHIGMLYQDEQTKKVDE